MILLMNLLHDAATIMNNCSILLVGNWNEYVTSKWRQQNLIHNTKLLQPRKLLVDIRFVIIKSNTSSLAPSNLLEINRVVGFYINIILSHKAQKTVYTYNKESSTMQTDNESNDGLVL